MVVGQTDSGSFRGDRPGVVGPVRAGSGRPAGRGQPGPTRRVGARRRVSGPAGQVGRRPRRLSNPSAVVPAATEQRHPDAQRHRVLLDGVRRRGGAAELLGWIGNPGRRSPQGCIGSRAAADRGRPVLPLRLLPAVADRGRLAARGLSLARSGRTAAASADRRRRCAGAGRAGAAGIRLAARPDLGGPGRSGAAAAAGFRHPRERARHARGHRPPVRRRPGTSHAAGDPRRDRRCARHPRVHRDRRAARARGVPHERGPRRVPRAPSGYANSSTPGWISTPR